MIEAKDLYPSFIAICVLNTFLSYSAIMLNIVTIHAIRKTSSLPKPLKTLLLSLAVSDLGVGLMVQPLYIAWLVKWLQQSTESNSTNSDTMEIAFAIVMDILLRASFFGVVAISVDRFLAIHLHLRYQELVTYKRVVAVVISIWVSTIFISLISLWISIDIACVLIFSVCFIFLTIIYFRIYIAVRRHTNQIQVLQVQQESQNNNEMTNFARSIKSTVGTFYMYLVFVICYLPVYLIIIFQTIDAEPKTTLLVFILYSSSWFLMLLNSSLNPVIYCWKMRHIRHAIMDILRNISERNN